jgi:tetratricopeptide (TPR) repeat protein
MKKAGIDLKKAFELSPNDVFSLWNLATFYAKNEEYITALNLFKRAEKISRDPLFLGAIYFHMGFELYLEIGDMDKALYFINKSSELNPLWEGNNWWYCVVTGKFQEALEIAKNMNWDLGPVYTYIRGKSDSAVHYLDQSEAERKVKEGENYHPHSRYGMVLIEVGRTEEGMAILNYHLQRIEQHLNASTATSLMVYEYAGIYSFLSETDKAIESLKRLDENYAWEQRIYLLQVDRLFDNIRDNVEYQEIVNNQLAKNKNIREEINRLEAAGEL